MRRVWILFGVTLLVALTAGTAQAGWQEFWHRVKLDWHRMNAWPEPFVYADREAYHAPWAIMKDNGWRLQNTLPGELFESGTSELTHAGHLKLRWIVTEAPVHRRTVFVLRADTAEETQARVESVQEALARIVPADVQPEVLLTTRAPRRGTGARFDQINRALDKSIPPPRLPDRAEDAGR